MLSCTMTHAHVRAHFRTRHLLKKKTLSLTFGKRILTISNISEEGDTHSSKDILPFGSTVEQYFFFGGKAGDCLRRACISLAGTVVTSSLHPLWSTLIATSFFWIPILQASAQNRIYHLPFAQLYSCKIISVAIKCQSAKQNISMNWVGDSLHCLKIQTAGSEGKIMEIDISVKLDYSGAYYVPGFHFNMQYLIGEVAELIIVSDCANFSRYRIVPEIYIPRLNIWIGEYPYVQKTAFHDWKINMDGQI